MPSEALTGQTLRRLRALAYSIVRNAADAEDAVQAALLLACCHSDQYAGRSKYLTWLSSITINEAINQIRRSRRVAPQTLAAASWLPARDPNPEEQAIVKDLMAGVDAALKRIPQDYATVFRLRELEQLSVTQTASVLGLTPGCVKTRLFRARGFIQREISERWRQRRRGRRTAILAAASNAMRPAVAGSHCER